MAVQLGLLLGGIVGVGKKYGVYTGLMGAFALIPLLGMGFVGVPVGIHYKKKFGLGLIIPLQMTQWWVGLLAGVALFAVSWKIRGELM